MIYFFDGTKAGFLTAFLRAFSDENAIVSSQKIQLPLGEENPFLFPQIATVPNGRKNGF